MKQPTFPEALRKIAERERKRSVNPNLSSQDRLRSALSAAYFEDSALLAELYSNSQI